MIHTCSICGQRNRVPEKYTGIPVCGSCKTQMFPTEMRAATSSVPEKRSRSLKDQGWLVLPILMVVGLIHWIVTYDWLGWLALITANLLVISAIALSWVIIYFALKVSWEEIWLTMQNRRFHPREEEDNPLNIGPWDALQDYITLARQKFALRKEQHHA